MKNQIFERYIKLVNFLGQALGPSYEVALHDLSRKDKTLIAISNGHITDRTIGASYNSSLKTFIDEGRYLNNDFEVNYTVRNTQEKKLRSSSFYIKDDEGTLIGLLCISFDDQRYRNVAKSVLQLCHPDELLLNRFEKVEDLKSTDDESTVYGQNIKDVFTVTLKQVFKENPLPMENIKKKQKMELVKILKQKGIFMLKDAIPQIAELLNCSQATIYRYLNDIEIEEEKERKENE